MSDSGPKIPLRPPITPPARKKRLFSDFRGPKCALLTPLFPPKPPENHPFSAHFRAPLFGQLARVFGFRYLPFRVSSFHFRVSAFASSYLRHAHRRLSPATREWSAISHSSITQFFNDSTAQSAFPPDTRHLAPALPPSALSLQRSEFRIDNS